MEQNKSKKDDKIFNNNFVLGGGQIDNDDLVEINFTNIESSNVTSIENEFENEYLLKIKEEYDKQLQINELFKIVYFSNLKNIPVTYYRNLFYTIFNEVPKENVSFIFAYVSCCELLKLKLDLMINYLNTKDKIRIYKSLLDKYPHLKNKISGLL
jgi:hypothetical protein